MRKWVCCCLFVLAVQLITWASATSRHLALDHHHDHDPQKQENISDPDSLNVKTTSDHQGSKGIEDSEEKVKGSIELQKKIGSRPPNCENKCFGCSPCEAIQVPTITSHFSIQYANYFPEGWKCKCGPSFYGP